jgi:hypothetical protein
MKCFLLKEFQQLCVQELEKIAADLAYGTVGRPELSIW